MYVVRKGRGLQPAQCLGPYMLNMRSEEKNTVLY